MSQLIALIIAIALGAIVTAIGFVFLGDAFTKNSERGVALQLVSQASQIEMALTAHRAEQAKSAYEVSYAETLVDTAASPDTGDGLVDLGYLKDVIVAPQGSYSLVQDTAVGAKNAVYLVASGQSAAGVSISANVCSEVEKLAGRDTTLETLVAAATPAQTTTALGANVYGCFKDDQVTPGYTFVYQVE